MSRKIKFRCWDSTEESFSYNVLAGNILSALHGSGDELTKEELIRYTLQQFIGLCDKNGKEIYEGDIVKYDSGSEYENEEYKKLLTSEVFYENGKYRIRYSADSYNWRKMEVIGNIFENKE